VSHHDGIDCIVNVTPPRVRVRLLHERRDDRCVRVSHVRRKVLSKCRRRLDQVIVRNDRKQMVHLMRRNVVRDFIQKRSKRSINRRQVALRTRAQSQQQQSANALRGNLRARNSTCHR
jgi:hypothetical protein